MADPYQLFFDSHASGLDEGLLVATQATGVESLSTLYSYDITLHATKAGGLSDDDVDALISEPCCISYWKPSAAPHDAATRRTSSDCLYRVHGVIAELQLLPTTDEEKVSYRARVVPKAWYAGLSERTRIHDEKTLWELASDIVKTDTSLGTDEYSTPSTDTGGHAQPQAFRLQYQESDWNFLSRHLEHWGVFYFFQDKDGHAVLSFGRSNEDFRSMDSQTLSYDSNITGLTGRDLLHSFSRTTRMLASRVLVSGYDEQRGFQRADGVSEQLPQSTHPVHDKAPQRGLRQLGQEAVVDNAGAHELAQLRAEALGATRETFQGKTNAYWVRPGVRFTLSNHPLGDLNGEYLVTQIEHTLETGADVRYIKAFQAIPYTVPYRPPLTTPRPRIDGLLQAMIGGPEDSVADETPAPIDDQGRYQVLLPVAMRADGKPGMTSSLRLRMTQPSTGSHHGVHLPLHAGAEVLIGFLAGDPDRPVIVGAAANADTRSPVLLENNTSGRIRSRNGILIEFEDQAN